MRQARPAVEPGFWRGVRWAVVLELAGLTLLLLAVLGSLLLLVAVAS